MKTFGWVMCVLNFVCAVMEAFFAVHDARQGDQFFLAVAIVGFVMCSAAVALWLYVIRKERSNA